MTAITLNRAPRMAVAAPKLRRFFKRLSDALDAFAMYQMQHAVSESELRRAEREIERYCRLMRKGAARSTARR